MKLAIADSKGASAAEEFKASRGWLQNFCRRYGVAWRTRTNGKHLTPLERLPRVRCWLSRLRRRILRGAENEEFGRWPLARRWNLDQVPISLDANTDKTYAAKGCRTIAVKGRKNAHKNGSRFCTCQLFVRLDGGAAHMVILFRGLGKRLAPGERAAYDPIVTVHFAPKAYYDDDACQRWACEDLPLHMKGEQGPHVLFLDNLSGQTCTAFRQELASQDMKVHYFVGGTTDMCQPIDAGIGKFIQSGFQRARDLWLTTKENFALWCAGMPVCSYRILVTKWLAAALSELRTRPDLIRSAAERTGCAMRPGTPTTGIRIQGLEDEVLDLYDVGDDFRDCSDSDDEPGADTGADTDVSDREDFVHGGDFDGSESEISHSSDDTDVSLDPDMDSVDPLVLLPRGHVRLPAPDPIQAAIGQRILVKVPWSRSRNRSTDTQEELRDWWSGVVACDTRSSRYKEMRANLGHNLVVRLDPAFRHCDGAANADVKSFALWVEEYGTTWLLYGRGDAQQPIPTASDLDTVKEEGGEEVKEETTMDEPEHSPSPDRAVGIIIRCPKGCRCADADSEIPCDCAGAGRKCQLYSCACGGACGNR
eukprot:GHVU01134083.1.p1 GENE.GHVU01134083.1~~GHVU01134083.1.p1  ORF type:complete len:627 (+),score=53.98 GHVU01134083.1:108-1883(+)